jgi:hypothetical protein
MASPFKVFRKHQKLMLAGLTILAMFSFIFLGTIADLLGTRQGPQNPVVVSTSKYGKLTQNDLAIMRQDRMRAHAVLQMMLVKLFPPQIGSQISQTCQQFVENTLGKNTNEDIVMSWLKAKRAEEIGMTISNDIINEFLKSYPMDFARSYPQLLNYVSENSIATQDIAAMINQQNLSQNQFFDILREDLRAQKLTQIFFMSLQGVTPAQRWEYFCQTRKQASVELIPVEVSQFLDQVKTPSDDELKAYFEKYKDKLPNPSSPEPGFRVPHKIDVQYFKADLAKFSDPATITDEEFKNAYEKNRTYFDQLEKEESKALTPEKKGEQDKEKTTEPEKKESTPAAEKPADMQKPADQPGAEPQKSTKEDTKKEDAKKSSALNRGPFSLASMAAEADKPADAAKDEKPAAAEPKTEKPAPDAAKAEKPAAEPNTEKSDAEGQKTEKPAENQAEKTEKPISSLSEKVRQRIRAQVAAEKIQKIFLQLQRTMEDNGKKWHKYQADKMHQIKTPAPPSLDFEALAKQYGLTAEQTGLISSQEVKKFDIGSSVAMEGIVPFASAAFKPSLTSFKPEISQDIEGNFYLYWKVEDAPEAAPSWDDKNVRQEVLHAWKLSQARALALKQAESMVETASKTGATLKGSFPDLPEDRIISPPPSSMLTEGSVPRGSSPQPPRLSEVEGVPLVGLEFMHAVFNLDINQIGVAMNMPKTVVYVVQLIKYSPPQDVLWQIFLAEDFSKYSAVAAIDLQKDQIAWLESLKTAAGLKWEILQPEQSHGESAPDSTPED